MYNYRIYESCSSSSSEVIISNGKVEIASLDHVFTVVNDDVVFNLNLHAYKARTYDYFELLLSKTTELICLGENVYIFT